MNTADKAASRIRILLVDDHPALRKGLALLLEGEADMVVAGEAKSGEEAVDMFMAQRPDVTLMDLRMSGMSGVRSIEAIRALVPSARVIVLTSYDRDEDVYQSLRAGAMGYLLKETPYEEIAAAIRIVHSGRRHFPSRVSEKISERLAMPDLSERELAVLQLMSSGLSNKEIAVQLSLAVGTVKYHVNNILSKLNAEDRTQAVIIAFRKGLSELT